MKVPQIPTATNSFGLLAAFLFFTGSAHAGDGACVHCGCECECRKICRLECTEKTLTTVCWTCQCEDFCLPGPSWPSCAHCDEVCDECSEPDRPFGAPKLRYWREWIPSPWSKVYTKKRLMKKTVTKTTPSYKWVVEELCPDCEAGCEAVSVPEGAEIPPAPLLDDVKIITVKRQSTRK